MSKRAVGWVQGRIDDGPVGSQRGEASAHMAADEDQLGLGVIRVHVEGSARGLTHVQGAAPVGCEDDGLQIVGILPRNLGDGFTVVQLQFLGFSVRVANTGGPDVSVPELDAGEKEK